jgi:hypothetical protein
MSYCLKCKTHTPDNNPEEVPTANGGMRIKSTCSICSANKSKMTKGPAKRGNGVKAPRRNRKKGDGFGNIAANIASMAGNAIAANAAPIALGVGGTAALAGGAALAAHLNKQRKQRNNQVHAVQAQPVPQMPVAVAPAVYTGRR